MSGSRQTVVRMDDLFHVHADVGASAVVTLALVGDLDHQGVGPLDQVLVRTWEAWPAGLTLDLRELDFINARGLACLLGASRTARRRGVPLVLRCEPGLVSRLVTLVGLAGHVVAPEPARTGARGAVAPGSSARIRSR